MTKFPIDREVLEDLRSDRALSDAADEIAGALEGLRDIGKLIKELLESVFTRIPAERGAVLIAGPDGRDLRQSVFRGEAFTVQPRTANAAFRERQAILQRKNDADVLCVALCMRRSTVGAIYLESSPAVFNGIHLRLLALVAAEVAQMIDSARHASSLEVQTAQYEEWVGHSHGLVGNSSTIVKLRSQIEKVAALSERPL